MPEDQHAIERLPLPTQSKLRSTQILTSLPQIISELVQNSLDANASSIDVSLDCKDWTCWVRDNGHGVSRDGLESLAQEGGRYNTSKTYSFESENSPSTFGFRGEALASAADISCLEICSRTTKSRNTWSVILKGGKTLYMGPAVRWKRELAGTTVCVRDAFYNLPVRRQSHPSPSKSWDLVRREIELYALVFPGVIFMLEDTRHSGESSQHKDRTVRIPKSASTLERFQRLYGHALTEHIEIVDTSSSSIKLEGFISLIGAPSKIYQFLYINRHPIIDSDLGRVIDTQFASSSFGKNALDEEGESNLPRSTIRRSPRKSEKKPVYVLDISIAPEEVDNCLDPTKNFVQLRNKSNVISLLLSTIQSFLEKHGFLNEYQAAGRRSKSSSPSPRKRKKFNLDDSGYAENDSITELSTLSLNDAQAATEAPSADLYTSTDGTSKEVIWVDPSTGERFLVDTRTGNSFRQGGNHPSGRMEHQDLRVHSVDNSLAAGRRTLRQHKSKNLAVETVDPPQSSIPPWLEKALESNRTYATSENRIPSVKLSPAAYHITPGHDPFQRDGHGCHPSQHDVIPVRFKQAILDIEHETSMHHLTKDDIRHAEIISQVDRKFIACRIPKHDRARSVPVHNDADVEAPSGSVLVLIDQHAADERIRVECFLKELCLGFLYSQDRTTGNQTRGVQTKELNPPWPILLTQHEAHTVKGSQDVRDMLQRWGVGFTELSKVMPYTASESGSSNAYSQLLVSSIPEVISDKLLQGDELRDFIKGFLGQIQSGDLFTDSHFDWPAEANQDDFLWLKAMRRCPKGLLDLINSKACRGAIMFNDSLSMSQCEKLVKQLCETAFPFQCAHGRPSLVPLIEIGTVQSGITKRNRPRNDWSRLETIADA